MLMGIGSAEIVVAVPILIAAIMAHCTPTTIAMAAWVTFHGVVGLIAGIIYYVFHSTNPERKRLFRIIYLAGVVLGIAIAIGAAIHGGVGYRVGYYTPREYHERNGTIFETIGQTVSYYNYSFDIFFAVFLGLFEILLLLIGLWFFYADKRKAARELTLAGTPRGSFANLQAVLRARAQSRDNLQGMDAKDKRGSVQTLDSAATRSAPGSNSTIEVVGEEAPKKGGKEDPIRNGDKGNFAKTGREEEFGKNRTNEEFAKDRREESANKDRNMYETTKAERDNEEAFAKNSTIEPSDTQKQRKTKRED